jgi:hypothetical protein
MLTSLTEGVQAFAPLSYFVCFLLAVILVPPAAGRLTWLLKRSSPSPSPRHTRSAPALAEDPFGPLAAQVHSLSEKVRQLAFIIQRPILRRRKDIWSAFQAC